MTPTPAADGHRMRHVPALDGLRGLAVIAVLLFHSELSWAKGGHLGVTTFFVLSGFLITSLLLIEHERDGRVDLRAFWTRRARRLVPAALLAVAVAVAYLALAARTEGDLLGDGVASLLWVANWRFIAEGASYADLFREPSPFRHFWSLAIEEQFYVLVPIVVVGVLRSVRSRAAGRWALGIVFGVVVVVSTEVAALLHTPGADPLRAYYGTDARIAEPALGALLAVMLCTAAGPRRLSAVWRRVIDVAGIAAFASLAWLVTSLGVWNRHLYEGGFLLAAGLAAVVVVAATQDGFVSRALSTEMLAAVGRISYGVYLFHWPLFLWLTADRTGLDPARLLLLRTTITLTLAVISYGLLELPIRSGLLPRRVGPIAWANATVALVAALAVVTGAVAFPSSGPTEVASGLSPSGNGAATQESRDAARAKSVTSVAPAPPAVARTAPDAAPTREPGAAANAGTGGSKPRAIAPTTTTAPTSSGIRVAFLGDSMSRNLAGGVARWGEASGQVVVRDFSIDGCPMSRGGDRRFDENHPWPVEDKCEWWLDEESPGWRELRDFRPDLIVVHDSTNEIPDRKLREWPSWMHPGDPVFDTWLTGEYRYLIDTVTSRQIDVLMLNAPCADWSRAGWFKYIDRPNDRVRALNSVVYHELGTSATRVVDLFSYLCPDGAFTNNVDGVEDARPDGIHLSEAAATRVAERLLGPAILEMQSPRSHAPGDPAPSP